MKAVVSAKNVDFTVGPILGKFIKFSLPIVAINVLQALFTMADLNVLGIFTKNDNAVAAVGATTVIINLLICFLTGLATGVNVVLAKHIGAKDETRAKRTVGTAFSIALIFSVAITIIGETLAEVLLVWTDCPLSILPYAVKYLRIYFLGLPILVIYNFSSAILRSVGESQKPLIYILIAGVLNVGLNIFFIVVVGLDIDGVAIATVLSNLLSGILTFMLVLKRTDSAKLEKKYFKLNKTELKEIVIVGLPLGLSSCLFSFANILVQTALNNLGDSVVTAVSITKEYDNIILNVANAFSAASISVLSQNFGARKLKRIIRTIFISMAVSVVVTLALAVALLVFGRALCGIATNTEEVLNLCMVRITTVSIFYVVLGIMQIITETIRALGHSFVALGLSIFSNIVLRLIYLFAVYPFIMIVGETAYNLRILYLLYPIGWAISSIVGAIIVAVLIKKTKAIFAKEKEELEKNNTLCEQAQAV